MVRTRGACGHAPFAGVGRKSEEALVHDEQRAHLLAAASRGIDHAGVDEAPVGLFGLQRYATSPGPSIARAKEAGTSKSSASESGNSCTHAP